MAIGFGPLFGESFTALHRSAHFACLLCFPTAAGGEVRARLPVVILNFSERCT